jgi:hypothetical protein
MPADSDGPHHLLQGGSRWGEHEIVALLMRIGDTAAHEQEVASIILPLVQHWHDGPVEEPGSLGSFAHRATLPILFAQHPGLDQGGFFSSAPVGCLKGDRLITGHGQHIGILVGFQPGAQGLPCHLRAVSATTHSMGTAA